MQFKQISIPQKELLGQGHLACQGCGGTIAMRLVLKALEENTIVVIPACCWTIIAGPFPYNSLRVPAVHCAFETAAVSASGIKAGLEMLGKGDTTVLAWAGDGGTFDIGIQSLSGSAERNDDILYCCYDNEAYMNTGIQRSSATPEFAWTTTTPVKHPKETPKKDIVQIMAGHRIPYVATANIAYPEDLVEKVRKAKGMRGTKFIHILSPCPPGWRMESSLTIKVARLASETKIFPLYEIFNGDEYVLTHEPKGLSVKEYLKYQRRFSHLKEEQIIKMQARVDFEWQRLVQRAMMEPFSVTPRSELS